MEQDPEDPSVPDPSSEQRDIVDKLRRWGARFSDGLKATGELKELLFEAARCIEDLQYEAREADQDAALAYQALEALEQDLQGALARSRERCQEEE